MQVIFYRVRLKAPTDDYDTVINENGTMTGSLTRKPELGKWKVAVRTNGTEIHMLQVFKMITMMKRIRVGSVSFVGFEPPIP